MDAQASAQVSTVSAVHFLSENGYSLCHKMCMYCGNPNDGASQMFTCSRCRMSVCVNGLLACVRPLDGQTLSEDGFECPQCLRVGRKPLNVRTLAPVVMFMLIHLIQYILHSHVTEFKTYQADIRPLLLYTAHESANHYFRGLLETQFLQEFALMPRFVSHVYLVRTI